MSVPRSRGADRTNTRVGLVVCSTDTAIESGQRSRIVRRAEHEPEPILTANGVNV